MRDIIRLPRVLKDIERMLRRGKDAEKLLQIVGLLARDGTLPVQYRPHKLHGKHEGRWECHIENDWLLIYNVFPDHIILIRTGSHADLFE